MLVTPIVPAQIVRSQWRALCRSFLLPALVLVGVNLAGSAVEIVQMLQRSVKFPSNFDYFGYQIVGAAVSTVKFGGNLVAVAWFGMWMGMTTRKTSFAIFKTICFVIILPAIALLFCQGMMWAVFAFAKMPLWLSNAIVGGLSLAKNIFFVVWARQRLANGFRDAMLRESRIAPYVPAQVPPPMPPPSPPPLMPPRVSPPPVPPSGVT